MIGLRRGGNIEDGAEEAGQGGFAGRGRAREADDQVLGGEGLLGRHFRLVGEFSKKEGN